MKSLRARNINYSVCASHGRNQILGDTSFELREGEFVTLLGRSGIGKTSVLNLLSGFASPDSGTIDNPFSTGYIFQEPALFPWLTVAQNVAIGPRMRRDQAASGDDSEERVARYLELVKLSHRHDNYPAQLSGGERQRAALAQNLIMRKELLLMDEPFASLDSFTRREMELLLSSIFQERHLTVLFVTHYLEEAIFLSDRVLILSQSPGTISEEVKVNLERPRPKDIAFSETFLQLKRRVGELFE